MNSLPTDMSRFQTQQSYTDLNQLNDIRRLGNDDQSLALKKIAQQFESMFMQMMLKSMRSANDVFAKDNPLNSFEAGFHRDMLDNQLSLSLSQGNQLGLAEALYRQLHRSYLSDSALTGEIQPLRDNNGLVNSQIMTRNNPYHESTQLIQQRNEDTKKLDTIKTPDDFIKAITPYAKEVAEKIGVDYKVIVAQSALETGWGEHSIRDRYGKHSFNLFNIKADHRWEGRSINVSTIEFRDGVAQRESANFRRYNNIAESFNDYWGFINQPRYEKALSVASNNEAFISELQNAGYATDPQYANKVNRIVHQYLDKEE